MAPNPKNGDLGVLDRVQAKTLLFSAPIDRLWNLIQISCSSLLQWSENRDLLVEVDAGHASWMFNENVKSLTRAVFVSCLSKHFIEDEGLNQFLGEDGLEAYLNPGSVAQNWSKE